MCCIVRLAVRGQWMWCVVGPAVRGRWMWCVVGPAVRGRCVVEPAVCGPGCGVLWGRLYAVGGCGVL